MSFQQVKNAFGDRENLYFIFDRNESIIKSVGLIFPNALHYTYIWLLWKNVCMNYKRSKNLLSHKFYTMAKCYQMKEFNMIIEKIVKIDHRIKDYLESVGYEKWVRVHEKYARVHASVNRGLVMTSNIAECINGCFVEARQLPIIDFLEEERILFGLWNCKNREKTSYTKETLGKKYEEILIDNTASCSSMKVHI